ncbi:hypothetical protein KI387_003527, partial [Taxus chinensis]
MTKSKAMPAGSKQWGSANSEWTRSPKQTIVYTTFVETDSHSFRDLVQKLTGVSEGEKLPVTINGRNSVKGSVEAGIKSEGDCSALIKSGIEVGTQKSAFNLHQRRKFQKRLEIKPGFYHDSQNETTILPGGKKYVISPTVIPSPITPLGPVDPFNTSPSYCYSSTPTSCNPSSYLEEGEKFCFQDSAI